jgi:hypothetical protein
VKKLPRARTRHEDEPEFEKEIWQPSWQCFCCHDSGIVQPHLTAIAIDGYDYNQDKLPRCQNPGCRAGSHWDSESVADSVDYRLSPAICQELDSIERESWRQTTKNQAAFIQKRIQETARKMNLRQRDRTSTEEMAALQRHQAALSDWGTEPPTEEEKETLQ